ncbi:MAG: hypothetical protein GY711_03585 [bacterium]|nr:hypothetical protein [bacterium]
MNEILTRWDELPPRERERLEQHPVHGTQLARLQQAEGWLREQLPEGEACPTSEELYDYGRGPGYVAIDEGRRAEIEQTLNACSALGACACRDVAASLSTMPPVPLEFDRPDAEAPLEVEASPTRPAAATASRPRLLRASWKPLAAAAALVVAIGLWTQGNEGTDGGFPAYPPLRGEAEQALLFPRGSVLSAGFFATAPRFELAPVDGAERYEVVLLRHAGDAFSPGERLFELEGESPVLLSDAKLDAGGYTWSASAFVDGLRQPLGERDFQVVANPELQKAVQGLEGVALVRALHEAGHDSDARHAARLLPASEERDAYLAARPGR